jgi:hypothetical protein
MELNIETPNFRDLILTCINCGTDFVLEADEQLFYFKRGLSMPKRCSECRQRRKAAYKVGGK